MHKPPVQTQMEPTRAPATQAGQGMGHTAAVNAYMQAEICTDLLSQVSNLR